MRSAANSKAEAKAIAAVDKDLLQAGLFKHHPTARKKHAILWYQAGLTPADFARYHKSVVARRPSSPAAVMGAAFKDFTQLVEDTKNLRDSYEFDPGQLRPTFFENHLRQMEPEHRAAFRRRQALGHMREKVAHSDWTLSGALRDVNRTFMVSPEISEEEARAYLDQHGGRREPSDRARDAISAMVGRARAAAGGSS